MRQGFTLHVRGVTSHLSTRPTSNSLQIKYRCGLLSISEMQIYLVQIQGWLLFIISTFQILQSIWPCLFLCSQVHQDQCIKPTSKENGKLLGVLVCGRGLPVTWFIHSEGGVGEKLLWNWISFSITCLWDGQPNNDVKNSIPSRSLRQRPFKGWIVQEGSCLRPR